MNIFKNLNVKKNPVTTVLGILNTLLFGAVILGLFDQATADHILLIVSNFADVLGTSPTLVVVGTALQAAGSIILLFAKDPQEPSGGSGGNVIRAIAILALPGLLLVSCQKEDAYSPQDPDCFPSVTKISQQNIEVNQQVNPLVFIKMQRLLSDAKKTQVVGIDSNTIMKFVLQHAYYSALSGKDRIYFKIRVLYGGQNIPINAMNFILQTDGAFDPFVYVGTGAQNSIAFPVGSVITYAPGDKLYFAFQSLVPIYMGSPYLQACSFFVENATYVTFDLSDPHNIACSPDGYVDYLVTFSPDTLDIPEVQ